MKKIDRHLRMLAPIGRGSQPVRGPEELMVDFCNLCNLHCLICFNYSPLSPCPLAIDERRSYFPRDLFIELLDDCAKMGGTRINLAGGGEPLMHPQCAELLSEIRKRGIEVSITSNGTLLHRFPELIDVLDSAFLSIHAGSADAYRRMHPADPQKSWENVLKGLKLLRDAAIPTIIGFIVTTENYNDIEAAIRLCGENGADIAIQPLKPFIRKEEGSLQLDPDKINSFQLTGRHMEELKDRRNGFFKLASELGVTILGLDEMLSLDVSRAGSDPADHVNDPMGTYYDENPCYAGWYFARVLMDGSVTPCCQCKDKITIGNINDIRFKDLWFSDEYRRFRDEALEVPLRGTDIWARCQCGFCDMVMKNKKVHRMLTGRGLFPSLLRLAGPFFRRRRQ
ncbi:MAG: radical SAM protein [Bacteroidales bacterium]|nr:radical SAM protein [Candidatus Latescibacterota bacterium]